MNRLVLATRNQDKIQEIQAMCAGMPIELLTLDRFPNVGDIIEDGDTLEANALKALFAVPPQAGYRMGKELGEEE